ncbi:MAG: hypothetical protein ACRD1V_05475 [Vicinamibacterales bacterium]
MAAVTARPARPQAAQNAAAPRLVWHGTIDDDLSYVRRAVSGGGVPRMPNPFIYSHSVHVDFEYVQEFDAYGNATFSRRHMNWSIEGSETDTEAFARHCHGSGSLDLSASRRSDDASTAESRAMQADCAMNNFVPNFRIEGGLPAAPPLPIIPAISDLDDNCEYRAEQGTRRTDVWLTPDVDAVVDLDVRPTSAYAKFVPEPGRTVDITARTIPAFPAAFRFVIDTEHTSSFAGYASNASIDDAFFKRFGLEHLLWSYTDQSPDFIFDPQMFPSDGWALASQGVVESVAGLTSATARVTAMDYGAIGRVKVLVKYKCGGWIPARVRVNGQEREAVSIPLDEDHNLMADALDDYKGAPDRDDDALPKGDGTAGDGLTAFEEYRGFMIKGGSCDDPTSDWHVRTTPRHKDFFVYTDYPDLEQEAHIFGWMADIEVLPVCDRHLSKTQQVLDAMYTLDMSKPYLDVPDDSRVVNFTLDRARQTVFDGLVVHRGPQHGVVVQLESKLRPQMIGTFNGYTIPAEPGLVMGPPRLTAGVFVRPNIGYVELLSTVHELGHTVGIPHHSDRRDGTTLSLGKEDITPSTSALQAGGIPLDSPDADALVAAAGVEGIVIGPGGKCTIASPSARYRGGVFVGCMVSFISRRGQQESGTQGCPMRYDWPNPPAHEPSGVEAHNEWSDVVTDAPNVVVPPAPAGADVAGSAGVAARGLDRRAAAAADVETRHSWFVDFWSGARFWSDDPNDVPWGLDKLCPSPAGTGVNSGRGDANLAGDAGRPTPCRAYFVINDRGPS